MRRGKLEQIIELLEACRKDGSTTMVMRTCNCNTSAFRSLMSLLQKEGFIECYPAKPKTPPCNRMHNSVFSRRRYHLTEKGVAFLKSLAPLLELRRKIYSPTFVVNQLAVNGI